MAQTYHPLIPRPAPALLSVVIPVYNEQEVVPILRDHLTAWAAAQPYAIEIVLVNDGSTDRTIDALLTWANEDKRVVVIGLARNFGHQAAITAGLDVATGDAIVVIDADLQDPPDVIPQMVRQYELGYDIVYGRRLRREGEPVTKKLAGWAFYRFMRAFIYADLPTDTGDFRLISRRTLDALQQMRETHRFVRGMVAWLGFPSTAVEYARPPRAAGESKYPWRRLAKLAWTGAISFSPLPLRVSLGLGIAVALAGLGVAIYALAAKLSGQFIVPGWTSQVVVSCLIGGAVLISNGMLGEYVGRIFEASKGRPLYVVSLKKSKDEG
ncbi:MAG TPA: glycosyltransferase family 2 protein [Tepidisphaeraceae bacterium]|jgi:dolichol-phosphate mannosyltransferase|nr:glycosyltransferase family 2 protein [Tepidisphaeraceae bacterium]